jgi:tetratricopeptide (TPR) repeat protein
MHYILTMPEVTAASLTPAQRDLFSRAKDASDKSNHDYVVNLMTNVLKEVPGFLEGRRLLRANEIVKQRKASSLSKSMASLKITPLSMKGKSALKKSPAEAMQIAEEILVLDPYSTAGNNLLAESAQAMELPELAVLAYETVRDGKPDDVANLKLLALAYVQTGQVDKAQATYQSVLKITPTDGEAIKGQKDASAMSASQQGRWDEGLDYRDSLKNVEESRQLEQSSKVVKSEDAVLEQITLLHAEFEQNNQNLNVAKKIAALYEQINRLEEALQWYGWCNHLANGGDALIEKKINDLTVKQQQIYIQSLEAHLAAATDPAQKAELQAQLDEALASKAGASLQTAKDRVAKYPNDLQLRFELGAALYEAGHYKEAVPELQQALRQPAVRHRAMNMLGKAFWKRNMLDFAQKQFSEAAGELIPMDALKKELIYNLAMILEESGKKDEALAELKKIYEVDYQYRDVAQRVEAAYAK